MNRNPSDISDEELAPTECRECGCWVDEVCAYSFCGCECSACGCHCSSCGHIAKWMCVISYCACQACGTAVEDTGGTFIVPCWG